MKSQKTVPQVAAVAADRIQVHDHSSGDTTIVTPASETVDVSPNPKPLVVDLDGTLVRSDLLVQSGFAYLGHDPWRVVRLLAAMPRGKAAVKALIAGETDIDVSHLPYDEGILSIIRRRRAEGQQVYLASASNERYVRAVADHLGLFDGWFASNDKENLSSGAKARRLVDAFGECGFDYIGNGRADLAVWAVASRRIAVRVSPSVKSKLVHMAPDAVFLPDAGGRARDWIKLLRVHQWAKNMLIFVPIVTAQRYFDLVALGDAVGAFVAFSLTASAIYILNDLVDIDADRKHSSKKRRPLATGAVDIKTAASLIPLLLFAGFGVAFITGPLLASIVFAYVLLTTAYTFVLKRKMLIDVLTLAALYTVRVVGGAAAISVPLSEWLLGFSMFIFTTLALIKRYVELAALVDRGLSDPTNRNYRKSDLDIVAALAAAAGFNAVTIFALYISSNEVRLLYRHQQALWLICPILMYWVGRALLMANRRMIDDDPVVFALRDRNSYVALALIGIVLIGAR